MSPKVSIAILGLVCWLCIADASGEPLTRVKRQGHSSGLSRLHGRNQAQAFQDVVNKWRDWGATGKGPGTQYTARVGNVEARLDLQGVEIYDGYTSERFNIQIGSESYAAVHVQRGYRFGVAFIRRSFEESQRHLAHVFLTRVETCCIPAPRDKNRYESRIISRRWHGREHKIKVWSTREVLDALSHRFHVGR